MIIFTFLMGTFTPEVDTFVLALDNADPGLFIIKEVFKYWFGQFIIIYVTQIEILIRA